MYHLGYTHTTLPLEAGANPLDVQERLGHSHLAITWKYAHNTDARNTAAKLDHRTKAHPALVRCLLLQYWHQATSADAMFVQGACAASVPDTPRIPSTVHCVAHLPAEAHEARAITVMWGDSFFAPGTAETQVDVAQPPISPSLGLYVFFSSFPPANRWLFCRSGAFPLIDIYAMFA